MRLGGNAFGELVAQRGQLLVVLSNVGLNRSLFLTCSVLELSLQVIEVCLHPVNLVLDALACLRNGTWKPGEGNGWEPGEGNGCAARR